MLWYADGKQKFTAFMDRDGSDKLCPKRQKGRFQSFWYHRWDIVEFSFKVSGIRQQKQTN